MNVLLAVREHRARVGHRCWACGAPVCPGQRYMRVVSVDCGVLVDAVWCSECFRFVGLVDDLLDGDSVSVGDLMEVAVDARGESDGSGEGARVAAEFLMRRARWVGGAIPVPAW